MIVAGNRDEFHARPTDDAHWWPDTHDVTETLGGRDKQAGGTWLALGRNGRFATVTNFRDAQPPATGLRSRGELVTRFLQSARSPTEYVEDIDGDRYAGFNLIAIDGDEAAYVSNRGIGPITLEPGIYGVANATLDTPWTKVERSKSRLAALIDQDEIGVSRLLDLLADRDKADVSEVESGRLPFDVAHAITAPFIVQPEYGTRCSTIVLRDTDGNVRFTEQRFRPDGSDSGLSEFSFALSQSA